MKTFSPTLHLRSARMIFVALFLPAIFPAQAAEPVSRAPLTPDRATLTVQLDQPGGRISPTLYGLFHEDWAYAAVGGLYPEKIRNRSFLYRRGSALTLSGPDPLAENSYAEPTKLAPVPNALTDLSPTFRHTFPAYSVTILRLQLDR